jgi:outer membrane protein TolC
MKTKTIILSVTLSCASLVTWQSLAQENTSVAPQRLSTDECRAMALEENATIRTAANDVSIASETSKEAFTKYFPEVSASGMAFKANKDIIQYDVLDLFTLGIIQKGVGYGVSAMQPIFAGGQIVNGNALAKVGKEVAEMRSKLSAEEVAVSVEKYYWKLVSLESQRSTLASLLTMLDTLEYQTSVAVDAGITLKNALLKVSLQRNDFQAAMIDLENGIALCSNLLGQFVGLGLTPVLPKDSIVPGEFVAFPENLWQDPSVALDNLPEYGMLNAAVKAAKLEKRIEMGKNLPTLAGGGAYVHHNFLQQNHGFWIGIMALQIPISGWWGGSHAVKRKAVQLENARIKLQSDGEMLQIGMMDAWNNLTSSYRKITTATDAIVQSSENLRLNEQYYQAGTATISDLLDSQLLYKKATDQYISAYSDFRIRRCEYLKSIGQVIRE